MIQGEAFRIPSPCLVEGGPALPKVPPLPGPPSSAIAIPFADEHQVGPAPAVRTAGLEEKGTKTGVQARRPLVINPDVVEPHPPPEKGRRRLVEINHRDHADYPRS